MKAGGALTSRASVASTGSFFLPPPFDDRIFPRDTRDSELARGEGRPYGWCLAPLFVWWDEDEDAVGSPPMVFQLDGPDSLRRVREGSPDEVDPCCSLS